MHRQLAFAALAAASAAAGSVQHYHDSDPEHHWCRNGSHLARGHWTRDTHVWELGLMGNTKGMSAHTTRGHLDTGLATASGLNGHL